LRNKVFAFGNETGINVMTHLTFITTYGVKRNTHSNIVQSEVQLDDLFTDPIRN